MDEIAPYDQNTVVGDTLIDELMDPALKKLILITPPHLLETKAFFIENSTSSGNQSDYGDGSGYVILPDDFVKLISFKMTEWKRPVTKAIGEFDPKYKLQKNNYTRGGIAKPVCVIRYQPTLDFKILEYYSVLTDHTIDHALYAALPDVEDFQEDLIEPLCWLIASDAFDILERPDMAKICKDKVTEFFDAQAL